MRTSLLSYLLFFVFVVGLTACADDDEEGISLVGPNFSISDITGTWNATQAIFGTVSGAAISVDVVAQGGSVVLVVSSDGSFTVTVTENGGTPVVDTGRMGFDEDLFAIGFDPFPEDYEFFAATFSGSMFTISGGNGLVEFDVDNDGVEEPADIDFIFQR